MINLTLTSMTTKKTLGQVLEQKRSGRRIGRCKIRERDWNDGCGLHVQLERDWCDS